MDVPPCPTHSPLSDQSERRLSVAGVCGYSTLTTLAASAPAGTLMGGPGQQQCWAGVFGTFAWYNSLALGKNVCTSTGSLLLQKQRESFFWTAVPSQVSCFLSIWLCHFNQDNTKVLQIAQFLLWLVQLLFFLRVNTHHYTFTGTHLTLLPIKSVSGTCSDGNNSPNISTTDLLYRHMIVVNMLLNRT